MTDRPDGQLTAIVVGAGLGGLAAAIALRDLGFRVQVLEQADRLGDVGAGIQLAPNATRVLESLGVAGRLAVLAVEPEAVVWRRWEDGACLRTDTLGATAAAEFGSPYWHVHRADLHRALVDTALDSAGEFGPVGIELDQRVAEVSESPDIATVITDRDSIHHADLVIGADGIHSRLRRWVTPEQPAVYSGDAAFRALIPADRIEQRNHLRGLVEHPVTTLWLGPGCHVVHYLVRGRRLLNIVALVQSSQRAAESWMTGASPTDLVKRFAGWDDGLLELFSLAEAVTLSGIYDRAPLPRWVRGRVALLGDACHPMLPYRAQGAAQAFEDADALGRVLRDAGRHEIPMLLTAYEAARKTHATDVQEASRQSQEMLHLDEGEQQNTRDAALRTSSDDAYDLYRWLWTPTQEGR